MTEPNETETIETEAAIPAASEGAPTEQVPQPHADVDTASDEREQCAEILQTLIDMAIDCADNKTPQLVLSYAPATGRPREAIGTLELRFGTQRMKTDDEIESFVLKLCGNMRLEALKTVRVGL